MFPLFVDVQDQPCLIIGGGPVAQRKARALAEFGARLTVIAPQLSEGWADITADYLPRCFADADLDGAFLVVAATDDQALNARISRLCQERRLPVNNATDPRGGSFTFPATVRRGEVTVGVNSGSAPALSRWLRRWLEEHLPPGLDTASAELNAQRQVWKQTLSGEQLRDKITEWMDEHFD